jgi:hypothetical protein
MRCTMESHGLWNIIDLDSDKFKKAGAEHR